MFYKGIPVREKPWFMKFPVMRNARGHVLFSKIYLRKDLFEKFLKGKLDPELVSVSIRLALSLGHLVSRGSSKINQTLGRNLKFGLTRIRRLHLDFK